MSLARTLEWLAGTIVISAATVFAVMRFAYSDFDTQRTNDVYRGQIEKRLDVIQNDMARLNEKMDRILERR